MPKPQTVFLDFDDTLSDPIPFFSQFAREIGRCLSARFGGLPHDWEKAAADMLVAVEDDYKARFVGNPLNGYRDWLYALPQQTMQLVFAGMGRTVPEDWHEIALTTQADALSRCNAAFAGAEEALAGLASLGYPLHMASGQESRYLRGGLTGMGLLRYLDRLFGPDLVDCAKEGAEYYERVFEAVRIRGEEAIVVDDYPPAIGWAPSQGATVIQAKLSVFRHEPIQPGVAAVLTDLHDLPILVQKIADTKQ